MAERKVPGAVDDAEFPVEFAKGPVPVDTVRLDAALETFPVMEQQTLAIAHSAFLCDLFQRRFGVLVREMVEMPPAFVAPGENPVVRTAFVTGMEFTGRHVMPGDIRMPELVQQLAGERRRTHEDHLLLTLGWHLLRHEIDPGEMGVINGQTVVVLDLDPFVLSMGGKPMDGNEGGC